MVAVLHALPDWVLYDHKWQPLPARCRNHRGLRQRNLGNQTFSVLALGMHLGAAPSNKLLALHVRPSTTVTLSSENNQAWTVFPPRTADRERKICQ